MRKKIWIPIISGLVAALLLLSPALPQLSKIGAQFVAQPGQSLGEILDPSGNPFVNRFSDVKDIRTATFVVAASDSEHKFEADYYCNGTNDHVEILAALGALPATGGEVALLDGTYNIGASVVMESNQTLSGCGRNTLLQASVADVDYITATGGSGSEKVGIVVRDIFFDGDSGAQANDMAIIWTYADESRIEGCWFNDINESAIDLNNCDSCIITNNHSVSTFFQFSNLTNCTSCVVSNNTIKTNMQPAVKLTSCDYCNLIGNTFSACNQYAIYFVSTCTYCNITGNNISDNGGMSICFETGAYCIIEGNIITNCGNAGIELYNTTGYNIIQGNIITSCVGYGIWNWYSDYSSIIGNIVYLTDYDGIFNEDSDHCIINDNYVEASGQDTDNTYANITLDGSEYCEINDNMCRQGSDTNQPDYGIKILGGCIQCMVRDNDLYDSGQTGPISDAGTLTHIEDNNRGIEITDVKMYRLVTNNSGGAFAVGDIVSLRAIAAGNEIITPTAVSDNRVYGMVAEVIANGASGLVQIKGKTTVMKATNVGGGAIGIGDMLVTEVGVRARKEAVTTDPHIAMALEVCGAANCVIDALIMSPWD